MATDYFTKKIDDKRRLTIPSDLQSEFKSGVVVTKGLNEPCLNFFSRDLWEREVEPRFQSEDIFDENVEKLSVKLRMGKLDAAPDDKQGRITLTQDLLNYAGITHEIKAVRVGNRSYFQVYDISYEPM
jgi:MraZ protein